MPHFDKRSGDIIVRIVYDGAPEAGKTTNVKTLGDEFLLRRRGRQSAPGTTGRRTEFFDWLDFNGGFLDGRRLRCQLVTVPGQSELLRRRRYLLESADAVVFIADSHPLLAMEGRQTFRQLAAMLRRCAGNVPIGVVLQANKQDRANALDPEELAARMEVSPDIPRFGAIANRGEGVRDTFLLAVRLATKRVRALLTKGDIKDAPEGFGSPEELHAQLLDHEDDAARGQAAAPPGAAGDGQAPAQETAAEDVRADAWEPDPTSPYELTLPAAAEIPSGCCWPSGVARELLASMDQASWTARRPSTWAPATALERTAGDWVLHTAAAWRYADLTEARFALVEVARDCLKLGALLPAGRALFVLPEQDEFRAWMLTPRVPSLGDRWSQLLAAGDSAFAGVPAEVLDWANAAAALGSKKGDWSPALGLGDIATIEGAVAVLALPPWSQGPGPDAPMGLVGQLAALIRHAKRTDEVSTAVARALLATDEGSAPRRPLEALLSSLQESSAQV